MTASLSSPRQKKQPKTKMSITLIIGPMFSGKTSELFRRLRRAEAAGQNTMLIKYVKDTRYDDNISIACSHDGIKMNATPVEDISYLPIPDADVVGIDEGQFIAGLCDWAQAAANAGKHVIVSALDSNFEQKTFMHDVTRIIPAAEKVIKLHAICFKCKRDASFTRRIDLSNRNEEVIGGADKYVATCRNCFSLPL